MDQMMAESKQQAGLAREPKTHIIRIKLMDGSKINGRVNINRNQGFDRLSDLVTSQEDLFLIVMDATLYEADIENPVRHKTIFVNKNHIVWAVPGEDG